MSNGDSRAMARAEEAGMSERLQKARELTTMTVGGARVTASSTADAVAEQASATAASTAAATEAMAETLGSAVTKSVQAAAYGSGAVAGGLAGTTGSLLLAGQISGSAAWDAARSITGSYLKMATRLAEGFLLALEDEEQGAAYVKQAAKDFAQETFDATTNASLGALGGAATAVGAVTGGAKGVTAGSVTGLKQVTDAGAEATYAVTKEASKAGTEAARRVLRQPEDA